MNILGLISQLIGIKTLRLTRGTAEVGNRVVELETGSTEGGEVKVI